MAAKHATALRMFVAELEDGQTVVVPQGARFATTDPVVKANPQHFDTTTPKRRGRKT